MPQQTRRNFLGETSTWLGLGSLAGLSGMPYLNADEGDSLSIALSSEIEPLVRLIEDTPREKSIAMMIGELRRGTTRNQFVAAMFLAAVRMKVSPHHVYMINSALRLSNDMPRETQLLPLFWALDTLQYGRVYGNRYPPIQARKVTETQAVRDLHDAMGRFATENAESAIISLARSTSPKAAMSQLWQYAGRDDGFIGHRAIALVNSWRVLETIGWQHAEPLLQFVVRELNAGRNEHKQHAANWERANQQLDQVPKGWDSLASNPALSVELFEVMRSDSDAAACDAAFKMLSSGKVHAGSIWDAIYLLGADFMIRCRHSEDIGTTPLHTNTSTNSLRFAFDESSDPKIRMYTLLAAVAWATRFHTAERKTQEGNPWLREFDILKLPIQEVTARPEDLVQQIFQMQPKRRHDESQKEILVGREGPREDQDKVAELAFSYASKYPDHRDYFQAARLLTAMKSTQDAHDVKFPVAIFENHGLVNPKWRPHLIAASSHYMHGTQMKDNPAVRMAKDQLG